MYWIATLLAGLILAADQFSKYWVQYHIPLMDRYWSYPYGGIPFFENFYGIEGSVVHAVNFGAAWSLFADFQWPLFLFRIVFIASFLIYLLFYNRARSWIIPSAIFLAGAVGNVCDYFIYGHVVDMIHLVFWGYHYPVFNVADSAIFTGVSLLAFLCWREQRSCRSCST